MAIFYSLDGSRATFQEYWWGSKNPVQLAVAAVIKLFRLKIPFSSDDANVDSTRSFVVESLSAELEQKFSILAADIQALGFCDPVYHVIEDHHTRTKIVWATYRHATGLHCARVHYRYWGRAQKTERALFPLFITAFANGTFLVSSSGKPDVAAPKGVRMNRMPKAPTAALWAQHEQLAAQMSGAEGCLLITNRDEVIEVSERLHEAQRDFHLARRFFRAQTAAEIADASDTAVRMEQARAEGYQHPEVMTELGKLQDAKASWKSALWLLALSLAIFIGAGGKQWSFKTTLWLVPILFFHEAGHWLAMRIFGYRNLRMFFIPLFGAAVTGRNWNVAGWKKALVSLAGPVPGIAVGAVLTGVALLTGNPTIRFGALLLIALNALNLAPVLPLDGGHFLQATLFCRNRWLDLVFKLIAVAGLIGLSVTSYAPMMRYVAIAMAVGLPLSFKLAQVTDKFRKSDLPPMLPGEDRISAASAAPLIEAVKGALPKSSNNKTIAQSVLNVFENLNARPPGVLATIGLMVIYGGSIVVSGLCIMLLVLAQHGGGLRNFITEAASQPRHKVESHGYRSNGNQNSESAAAPRDLVVATCKKTAEATKLFDDVQARLPKNGVLTQFGDSVILSLPSRDHAAGAWFDTFQASATNTFTVVSNNSVLASLMFVAPNAIVASNIESELSDYFMSEVAMQIAPPWDNSFSGSDAVRYKQARQAWKRINRRMNGVWESNVTNFTAKIAKATLRGDVDKAAQLRKAQQIEIKKAKALAQDELNAEFKNTAYADLVGLRMQLDDPGLTNSTARGMVLTNVAQRLGPSGVSVPGGSGYVSRAGLLVHISYATIRNPQTSLPKLLDWVSAQKCIQVKYDIMGGGLMFDETD